MPLPAPDTFLDERLDPVVHVSCEEHDAHIGAFQDLHEVVCVPNLRAKRHPFTRPDQIFQIGLVKFLKDPRDYLPAGLQVQAFRLGRPFPDHGAQHQGMSCSTQRFVLSRTRIKEAERAKFFVLKP